MMRSPLRQGVTFPELLVAMLCATLVAWMVFDLVGDENRNYTRTRAKVRTQNDAREAMRIIEEDMKNSGFHRIVLPKNGGLPTQGYDSICLLNKQNRVQVIDGGAGSDQLILSSYLPANDRFCGDAVQISYSVDAANNLVRSLTRGANAPIRSVVLPSVQTLQFQMGVDTTADDTARRSPDTLIGLTNTGLPAISATGATGYAFPNNDTVAMVAFTPMTVAALQSAALNLLPNSTYQVSLDLMPNQNLISWHDPLPNANEYIQLGMSTGAVWIPGAMTTVAFPPNFRRPNRVLWQVTTDNSGLSASLRLELKFPTLVAPGSQPETLYVSRLRMVRIRDAGQTLNNPNWTWYDGDNTRIDRRRQTLAVRAWILSKSTKQNIEGEETSFGPIANWNGTGSTATDKNTYVLHERVILVVNP